MSAPTLASTSALKFDVVIVGGGFAGIYCAQALASKLGLEARQRVAILAEENFMVFQPMLPEIAGSALAPRHVVNPIRRLCDGVTVLRARVREIDLPGQTVMMDPGDFLAQTEVKFEHLVLAMGGVVDLSRVPGMPEHAYLMKNVGDALKLRGTVIDRFEEANLAIDPEEQRRLLTFAIVGGGYSGVETAGQIFDFAKEMVESYTRISPEMVRVVLIHSGPHLLPEISRSLGEYAEHNLRNRGLEIVLNARVTAMTAGKVMLGDGRVFESHTVVSTVGNAPHPVLVSLCKKEKLAAVKGRIITDETMRVPECQRLWAAGDCAAVPMKQKGGDQAHPGGEKALGSPFDPRAFCPPTAQFAQRQGTLLGKNLAKLLQGRDDLRPFTFTGLGELAAIGHMAAVAEIAGLKFQGFIAWWMWRTIYLMKLPGLERKLRVMIDWTLDIFFPRDIAMFQSKPTQLLREMHLELGDVVFHVGDPAWSIYIVKSGSLQLNDASGEFLRSVQQGEQVGRKTLQDGRVWKFSAIATAPTTLTVVSAKVFETVTAAGTSVEEVFPVAPDGESAGPTADPKGISVEVAGRS